MSKATKETLTDVATDELEMLAKEIKAAGGAMTVTPQSDGKWTVVAVYPEG